MFDIVITYHSCKAVLTQLLLCYRPENFRDPVFHRPQAIRFSVTSKTMDRSTLQDSHWPFISTASQHFRGNYKLRVDHLCLSIFISQDLNQIHYQDQNLSTLSSPGHLPYFMLLRHTLHQLLFTCC